jgi:hypothetical protein
MDSRQKRMILYVLLGVAGLAGSALVLPIGVKSAHRVNPMAAGASLLLAIAGFVFFLMALARAFSRPASSR